MKSHQQIYWTGSQGGLESQGSRHWFLSWTLWCLASFCFTASLLTLSLPTKPVSLCSELACKICVSPWIVCLQSTLHRLTHYQYPWAKCIYYPRATVADLSYSYFTIMCTNYRDTVDRRSYSFSDLVKDLQRWDGKSYSGSDLVKDLQYWDENDRQPHSLTLCTNCIR